MVFYRLRRCYDPAYSCIEVHDRLNFYNAFLLIILVIFVICLILSSYEEHDEFAMHEEVVRNSGKYREPLRFHEATAYPFQLVLPFQMFEGGGYEIVPDISLSVCQIQKVMSMLMTSIFCYLFDTEAFLNANRTIATEVYDGRFCDAKNEYCKYQDLLAVIGGKNYTKMALIREPMDRFISGFVDKCINEVNKGSWWNCHGCNGDLKCFLENQYRQLKNCSACSGYNYEIAHFAPQNWYCEFKTHYDEYHVMRYSHSNEDKQKLADEFCKLLEQKHVSTAKIEHIRENIMSCSTVHATNGSNSATETRDKLMKDLYLLSIFSSIYYYDYFLFKFDLPMNAEDIVSLGHLME